MICCCSALQNAVAIIASTIHFLVHLLRHTHSISFKKKPKHAFYHLWISISSPNKYLLLPLLHFTSHLPWLANSCHSNRYFREFYYMPSPFPSSLQHVPRAGKWKLLLSFKIMNAATGQSHQRLYRLQKILSFYGSQLPVFHRRFTTVKEKALQDNL